jgi:hypothetical protein
MVAKSMQGKINVDGVENESFTVAFSFSSSWRILIAVNQISVVQNWRF